MSELDQADTVLWSERQADLLRRLARGERVNDQLDWANIIEEIEAVGREERRAVTSALKLALQHKLYLLGWPDALAVRHWQESAYPSGGCQPGLPRTACARTSSQPCRPSYRRARLAVDRHMLDAGPMTGALPTACPWTLDELLAEGRCGVAMKRRHRSPADPPTPDSSGSTRRQWSVGSAISRSSKPLSGSISSAKPGRRRTSRHVARGEKPLRGLTWRGT